jgi:hypothetical protein
MKDFGQLSSKTVTEVLMLEMKMAPAAKTYLVSGYPRNMRDVVEYSEKVSPLTSTLLAPRLNCMNIYLGYIFQIHGSDFESESVLSWLRYCDNCYWLFHVKPQTT